jgi:hypothetical protein
VPSLLAAAAVNNAFGTAKAGPPTRVVTLAAKVGSLMAMTRLRNVVAFACATGVLAVGSAALVKRAWGDPPGKPPQERSAPSPATKPEPVAPEMSRGPRVSDARLEALARVRDDVYREYMAGEATLEAFLTWQKRYADAVRDRAVTPRDRVRTAQGEVKGLRMHEERLQKLNERGQAKRSDLSIVKYYRLEAEENLANATRDLEAFEAKSVENQRGTSSQKTSDAGQK